MKRILIVDDDRDFRFNLSNLLKTGDYDVITAETGTEALRTLEKDSPNLVLLDIKLPGMNGMKILEKMKGIDKDLIIIMLTACGAVNGVVTAMKAGAFDYITKPFDNEELLLIVKKALHTQSLSQEVESLRKRLDEKTAGQRMIGQSPIIKRVLQQVEIIAPTSMTAVLQGESGTGKEIIAHLIHQKSSRKDYPFIAIDCGAIPESLVESELFGHEKGAFTGADHKKEGKFEQANKGTLFLDEIMNLSDNIQMKLLRVLQERKLQRVGGKKDINIDTRIIVATNIDLHKGVSAGKFRHDLFHRLNEFSIDLPSLKERKEDIPILAKYFLDEANQEINKKVEGFSNEVMKSLIDYSWPGNVRELKNVVKKAVLLANSNIIKEKEDVSLNNHGQLHQCLEVKQYLEKDTPLYEIIRGATNEIEKQVIIQVLAKTGGNKSKAARMLQIDRMTLYSKIKELQL